jgi:CheY-like chemotaxis protein
VLLNLLSNAVKFTETGSISLGITVESRVENQARLRFEVTDTGIGMDDSALGRLFQSFSQADSSMTRRYGGTGLGLVISKRLINLMGGDIAVKSEPGKGSCFSFVLDTETAPDSSKAAALAGLAGPAGNEALTRPWAVLLAEDNVFNQKVAQLMLTREGCTVDIVSNGLEAVKMAASKVYDMIILDCQMPGMDGFEAAAAIRNLEAQGQRTPIIAATANAFVEDRSRCIAAGMDDFISKPLNKSVLHSVLRHWL